MYQELDHYFEEMVSKCVPRRTKQRQRPPQWIQPSTSNLLKKGRTQKSVLITKSTSYRQKAVAKLWDLVLQYCEWDRIDYQENILATGDSERIFKPLRHLQKIGLITEEIEKWP